jgi:hypothetical protein
VVLFKFLSFALLLLQSHDQSIFTVANLSPQACVTISEHPMANDQSLGEIVSITQVFFNNQLHILNPDNPTDGGQPFASDSHIRSTVCLNDMQYDVFFLTPDARYGVWRVLIDLEFPVLLLRACRSLLSSDEQHTMPVLVACDPEAAAAVELARTAIERMQRERTVRDIELWSATA